MVHIRYAPRSYITKSYIRIGKKRDTGKAIVAAAAKMLHVAYCWSKRREGIITDIPVRTAAAVHSMRESLV